MASTDSAVIYADGACLGNPGPAGAGYVIVDEAGITLAEAGVPLGHGTNNIAEYGALIAGLEAAAELGLRRVRVRSDSQLMCRQMTGQYRVKNAALRRLHVQARRLMEKFAQVAFECIPRESNERADALAKEAARSARDGTARGGE